MHHCTCINTCALRSTSDTTRCHLLLKHDGENIREFVCLSVFMKLLVSLHEASPIPKSIFSKASCTTPEFSTRSHYICSVTLLHRLTTALCTVPDNCASCTWVLCPTYWYTGYPAKRAIKGDILFNGARSAVHGLLSSYHLRACRRASLALVSFFGLWPASPLYALKRFLVDVQEGHL